MKKNVNLYLITEHHINALEAVLREFESVFLDIYANHGADFDEDYQNIDSDTFNDAQEKPGD